MSTQISKKGIVLNAKCVSIKHEGIDHPIHKVVITLVDGTSLWTLLSVFKNDVLFNCDDTMFDADVLCKDFAENSSRGTALIGKYLAHATLKYDEISFAKGDRVYDPKHPLPDDADPYLAEDDIIRCYPRAITLHKRASELLPLAIEKLNAKLERQLERELASEEAK